MPSCPATLTSTSPKANSVRRALRKLASLTLREPSSVFLLARMAAWTVVISLAARVLPLPKALGIVAPRRRHARSRSPAKIVELADLLFRANVAAFTPTCWKRAAVLHRYLLLAGIENRVVFGVRRAGESALDGHAWIEVDGKPFSEPAPPKYQVTFAYPGGTG